MLMQFGQFLDHDITLTPQAELDCCSKDFMETDGKEGINLRRCFNIPIDTEPDNEDEFFFSDGCSPLTRSDVFCPCNRFPREQINGITAFVDGSNIYGSADDENAKLREVRSSKEEEGRRVVRFSSAELKSNGSDLPSRSQCGFHIPATGAEGPDDLVSGDVRASEQPALSSLHTLFLNEHNRIVRALRPLITGDAYASILQNMRAAEREDLIFQLARRMVAAELQQITYKEYLPLILGKAALLDLDSDETNYDPSVNPSILNEFATVAFRFGHSTIADIFQFHGHQNFSLAEHFFDRNGIPLVVGKAWQHQMVGLSAQVAPACDLQIGDACRNKLFKNVNVDTNGKALPGDLVARNIQRAREHGIPGYASLREACGIPLINNQRPNEIKPETWDRLMNLYGNNASQVDPFTGGLAEEAPLDGQVGPLFACIIGQQFKNMRDGDRFFFTHKRTRDTFSRGLGPIAKANILQRTLGSIFCDNLDADILSASNIGRLVFKEVDVGGNIRLDCNSIRKLDFEEIVQEAMGELVRKELPQNGVIESPNFPDAYKNDFYRNEKIEVEEGFAVELIFQSFDIESKSCQCDYDWVEVIDNDGTVLMGKTCGNKVPESIISNTNLIFVRFNTDSSIVRTGFKANWKQVKAGKLTSPKFPNDYPNYVDEYTFLTAEDGEVMELRFDTIDIEGESPECKYDSVSVYDTDGGQLCKLCGRSRSRKVFRSSGRNMTVRFYSDWSGCKEGFIAHWKSAPKYSF